MNPLIVILLAILGVGLLLVFGLVGIYNGLVVGQGVVALGLGRPAGTRTGRPGFRSIQRDSSVCHHPLP
jgi:hypothetical protein